MGGDETDLEILSAVLIHFKNWSNQNKKKKEKKRNII